VRLAPSREHFAELSQAVQDSLVEYEERQRERLRRGHRTRRAVKRVCYGELGCFEDSGPFAYLEMLPSPPEEINTKFYFYSTRQRSDRPLMELSFLNMTNAFRGKRETEVSTSSPEGSGRSSSSSASSSVNSSPNSTFSTERPSGGGQKKATPSIDDLEGFDELSVRVIVHGFGSACPHVWIYEMKTALMAVVSGTGTRVFILPYLLHIQHFSGGLHCDLRGLGEWSHFSELCESCGQYAFGGQTAGHVAQKSPAAQGS